MTTIDLTTEQIESVVAEELTQALEDARYYAQYWALKKDRKYYKRLIPALELVLAHYRVEEE